MAEAADAIFSVPISSRNLNQWGTSFREYDYVNPLGADPTVYEGIDLETLTIKISNRRAVVIESEVEPMAVRMSRRNDELDLLGKALSDLSAFSADYVTNTDGQLITQTTKTFTQEGFTGLILAGLTKDTDPTTKNPTIDGVIFTPQSTNYQVTLNKDKCDKWTQLVKTAMDTRNNDSSLDMTRIQSLVDRRDEAYKSSSSLSDKISGTRSNTIKNFV